MDNSSKDAAWRSCAYVLTSTSGAYCISGRDISAEVITALPNMLVLLTPVVRHLGKMRMPGCINTYVVWPTGRVKLKTVSAPWVTSTQILP